jgi:cyclase
MLARRIIPVQLLQGGRLVKTRQFDKPRDVGNPVSSSRVYYANGADELVFLHIDRGIRGIAPLVKVMAEVSQVLFVPLAAGGGVWTHRDARELINAGADKVILNTVLYHEPTVLRRCADMLGCQSVVVSIDVKRDGATWNCYSNCGTRRQDIPLRDHIESSIASGAGEIFIQSIDRDGMRDGYDLDLIKACIGWAGSTPVVACGGAGTYEHLAAGFDAGLDGAAAGSLFNFSDCNPMRAKSYLRNHGIRVR